MSDSLSGADGTQLPDPMPVFPDSLTAPTVSSDPNGDRFDPVALAALPDERAMREAIAAALGEQPADQAPLATPRAPGGGPGQRPPSRPGAGTLRPTSRPTTQASQSGPGGSGRSGVSGPSGSYLPVAPADLRRRISRDMAGSLPRGWRPSGCVITLIVLGLVVFSFLAGFVESLARLLQ